MSKYSNMITTIDSHTGGQPTRTILSGLPRLHGNSVTEKMLYMEKNLDWVRMFLTSEPRGTSISSVAVLTEPSDPEADAGVFFYESQGYMPMCGHNTIGVVTVLIENGMVPVSEPITNLGLETPNGLIQVRAEIKDGQVKSVAFRNTECFVYDLDMSVEYKGTTITFDVGFGGNFYAIIPAKSMGIVIEPSRYDEIVKKAQDMINIINTKYNVSHPEMKFLKGVTHIQFIQDLVANQEGFESKNAVVYMPGEIDRSPCGTGTSARCAVLHARGLMKVGDVFTNRSIIDSVFKARIIQEVDYFGKKAVIPEITGNAFITGKHMFMLDPNDDKGYGFKLGR